MNAATKKLTVWHAGERALQEQVGVAERMEQIGERVIRDFMPDQHRELFEQLPFVVVGSVDGRGDAWATLLAGEPGFVHAPTSRTLEVDARPALDDPAGEGLRVGEAVGLLGIELPTRRRNRANGIVRAADATLRIDVEQSFGNCPKYIHPRRVRLATRAREREQPRLDPASRAMIEAADTFFVASYADREGHRQVDVSHRGGWPGFVRVAEDGTLTVPDFSGNMFFNTLGNIVLNGKAGLVFVDWESGAMLQLSGDAEVILDSPELDTFQGAERLWRLHPRRIVRTR
jgi:predicted pyridoxine 5'-phosphate oxidase superfamily flavin-nucleotide-binding protein